MWRSQEKNTFLVVLNCFQLFVLSEEQCGKALLILVQKGSIGAWHRWQNYDFNLTVDVAGECQGILRDKTMEEEAVVKVALPADKALFPKGLAHHETHELIGILELVTLSDF